MPVYLYTWYTHTHSDKGKAAVTSVGDSSNTSATSCHLWERLLLISWVLQSKKLQLEPFPSWSKGELPDNIAPSCRSLPHPLFPDAGVCWDSSLPAGNCSGPVYLYWWTRSLEISTHVQRYCAECLWQQRRVTTGKIPLMVWRQICKSLGAGMGWQVRRFCLCLYQAVVDLNVCSY